MLKTGLRVEPNSQRQAVGRSEGSTAARALHLMSPSTKSRRLGEDPHIENHRVGLGPHEDPRKHHKNVH